MLHKVWYRNSNFDQSWSIFQTLFTIFCITSTYFSNLQSSNKRKHCHCSVTKRESSRVVIQHSHNFAFTNKGTICFLSCDLTLVENLFSNIMDINSKINTSDERPLLSKHIDMCSLCFMN